MFVRDMIVRVDISGHLKQSGKGLRLQGLGSCSPRIACTNNHAAGHDCKRNQGCRSRSQYAAPGNFGPLVHNTHRISSPVAISRSLKRIALQSNVAAMLLQNLDLVSVRVLYEEKPRHEFAVAVELFNVIGLKA